ncbi:MAG: DNA (cytosine-5-)-methyltransferase [Alicyclobacillus sp.]|nr:DNA (cytosine-5-)-methyltransferase [Alicyclobacillus sp.]
MVNYMELFAGIGGFRRGLEVLGHKCVGWVEWDKYARQSYMAIWPEARDEWNATDITTVTDDDLRNLRERVGGIDLLCFGSPCQDVSVAGRRAGFTKDGERTRSGLFFEAMRFARILRPDYLLMENVVGLLSSNEGEDFAFVIAEFHQVGMEFVEWDVLNAKDFGIPQNRERIFIVGSRRGSGRKVFPLGPTDGETAAE